VKFTSLLLAFASIALVTQAEAECPIPADAHTVTESAMTVTGDTVVVEGGHWHHAGPMYIMVAERRNGTAVFSFPDNPDDNGCHMLKSHGGGLYVDPDYQGTVIRISSKGWIDTVAFSSREFWH